MNERLTLINRYMMNGKVTLTHGWILSSNRNNSKTPDYQPVTSAEIATPKIDRL